MAATTTVSTRLDESEMALLDSLAEVSGADRSTLVRSLMRRGMKQFRLEQAVEAYRHGAATLSRSAEIAGISLWDFLSRMESESLDLHYGVEEFEADLKALDGAVLSTGSGSASATKSAS